MTRSTHGKSGLSVFIEFEPGQRVRHPQRPDWGVGQVQSAIGGRITVNFPHAGKVVVNAAVVALDRCADGDVAW